MKYGRYGYSHIILRCGLGVVFLWIGVDMFRHPDAWIGYLPANLPFGLTRPNALNLNGAFDVLVGTLFILGKLPKITALLAVIHLVAILATQGVNAVIIRDVGLLGASLSLLAWPSNGYRKNKWWKWGRRSSSANNDEE